jgi:hypothetical protein
MTSEGEQKDIEEEFLSGWNYAEANYANLIQRRDMFAYLKPMLVLIAEMRAQGYDKQLAAITSMSMLILSRSRQRGLPYGQARLDIDMNLAGGIDIRYGEQDFKAEFTLEQPALTPELQELLTRLSKQPIVY